MFHRHSRAEWRRVGDEVVLLNLDSEKYFSLNATGAVLWERLGTGATEADLVQMILDQFGVTDDVAAADVAAFLGQAVERDLVVESP